MRIISGSRKGRKLVDWEDAGIRPMRDFVRSALYNIISDLVPDARFLDLFAGTGSVGLEALSRGARECAFVDSSPEACAIVRRNLDRLGLIPKAQVIQADYQDGIARLARRGRRFDLVFVGPPYGRGLAARALALLGEGEIVAKGAIVATEVYKKEELAPAYGGLTRIDSRTYGDNTLHFYEMGAKG